jgi:hypothetical protein
MAKTKAERLKAIHDEAIAEFDEIIQALEDEREQCLQDRRFYSIAGAQWEGALGEQFTNKPKFEVNKIHLSVIRIFNEYRANRITVDYVSTDGTPNEHMADVCDGLYRATEQDSNANEAYDNAFEEAVGGGFGAWRLRAVEDDEEDIEDDKQKIIIEPIFDADATVFFDLDARRQDKSDAKRCFVLTPMSRQAYEEEYGDDPDTWGRTINNREFDWAPDDIVYVAEYYRVVKKRDKVLIYRTIDGEEQRFLESEGETEEQLEILDDGGELIKEKPITRKLVRKYILSGGGVLEDLGEIAGAVIPIVPVYAKRWYVDGIERCMGHVRLAKDVQRLKNMQLSKLGELSALSQVEKPIFSPEQIAGHELSWSKDNVENYPYLLANPMTDADGNVIASGPTAYTRAPQIPPAMAALLQITEQDMSDLLGNQQEGEEVMSNISGKAVELIQNRLDMQSFIYMSNMSKAVRRSGEVWLAMAKDIYVEKGRKLKSVGPDKAISSVELLEPKLDQETGETYLDNDLSTAKFNVSVDVGPSSSSKRAATVRAITGMMQVTADPETLNVLSNMAMMNMEGEGLSDARKYFRQRLVLQGVLEPTTEEAEQLAQALQNQQPDANTTYLEAAAMKEAAQAEESKADVILKLAKAEREAAETAKTAAETVEMVI